MEGQCGRKLNVSNVSTLKVYENYQSFLCHRLLHRLESNCNVPEA